MVNYLIGLTLYALGEGVTEGLTWEMQDGADNCSSRYHLWRIIEMLGIALMLFSLTRVMFGTWRIVVVAVSTLAYAFLAYRTAFILTRKQSYITPTWEFDLYVPILKKTLYISYPPTWTVVVSGVVGFAVLLFWM